MTTPQKLEEKALEMEEAGKGRKCDPFGKGFAYGYAQACRDFAKDLTKKEKAS